MKVDAGGAARTTEYKSNMGLYSTCIQWRKHKKLIDFLRNMVQSSKGMYRLVDWLYRALGLSLARIIKVVG